LSLIRRWKIREILREAISEWLKDDASLLAAALAYFGLFSFVPLLIIILIIINFLFMQGFFAEEIAHRAQDFAGLQPPRLAEDMIDRARDQAASFRFTLLSVLLLIFGAAGLFVQTKRAFHIIWKLPEEEIPFLNLILSYLRSFLLIALVAFLLLATSIFSALLLPVGRQIEELLPAHLEVLRLITNLLTFTVTTLLFALSYKTLTEVKLDWRDVLPGSALAALLFSLGNFFIEIYAGLVDIGSAFGAAGSLVVFLLWIYYSAQIFLFGAEVIKVQKKTKMSLNK
jgi:membrane protein